MFDLVTSPEAWAALVALIALEIVLGIDNLIFIAITTQRLPARRQPMARQVGIGLALVLRLVLLTCIAYVVGLTAPVFDLGLTGPLDARGEPAFETTFSWRDLILIGGGLFLVWKATTEIQQKVAPDPAHSVFSQRAPAGVAAVIAQIVALDLVFSIDSILTAVGMTEHVPVMIVAVIVAVAVMALAAGPVSAFVEANPTVVMLALAFLMMIGMVLIADGFGHHVPKGYIYSAMAFAAFVEGLNILSRRRRRATGGA